MCMHMHLGVYVLRYMYVHVHTYTYVLCTRACSCIYTFLGHVCVWRGMGEYVCACMNVGMYILIAHPALGKEMCSRKRARDTCTHVP